MSTTPVTPTVQDYLDLIPPPNSLQPKFTAWTAALLKPFMDLFLIIEPINQAFVISQAQGPQLDILGQILNVKRNVSFQPSLGDSPILPDSLYQLCLIAKIMFNNYKGTIGEIYNFWQKYIPGQSVAIQDNQDMSMTVFCFGMAPGIQQDLVTNGYFVPKPEGVRINYVFSQGPYFGFGPQTQYIGGFNVGVWFGFASSS